jgi:hypothetical protein
VSRLAHERRFRCEKALDRCVFDASYTIGYAVCPLSSEGCDSGFNTIRTTESSESFAGRICSARMAFCAAADGRCAPGVWSASQQSEPLAERHDEPGIVKEDVGPPARRRSQPEPSVRVTLSDPSTAILVPVKTEAPNVSIVWVYPTLKPARLSDRTETN